MQKKVSKILSWALIVLLPIGVFGCWNATRPVEDNVALQSAEP